MNTIDLLKKIQVNIRIALFTLDTLTKNGSIISTSKKDLDYFKTHATQTDQLLNETVHPLHILHEAWIDLKCAMTMWDGLIKTCGLTENRELSKKCAPEGGLYLIRTHIESADCIFQQLLIPQK